jgi:catechol 2,3-dioxygenase-like lactoylglutathione lyase family enzyme
MAVSIQVTFDCADPDKLARFWAEVLGYHLQDPPEGFDTWEAFLTAQGVPEDQWNTMSAVVDPDGKGPRLLFQCVPEGKTVKNRVHLDVNIGGGMSTPPNERRMRVDAAVERLVTHGATRLQAFEQHGEYWVVMQDPEGNEFCLQ